MPPNAELYEDSSFYLDIGSFVNYVASMLRFILYNIYLSSVCIIFIFTELITTCIETDLEDERTVHTFRCDHMHQYD